MLKQKKRIRVLALMVMSAMLLFIFAGCAEKPAPAAPAVTPVAPTAPAPAAPATPAAPEKTYVMRMGCATSNDGLQHYLEAIKAEVEKKTDKLKLEVYPGCQLGSNGQMLQDLASGALECLLEPSAFLGGFQPGATINIIPYIFPDVMTGIDILNGNIVPEYSDYFRSKGIEPMAFSPYGINRGFCLKFEVKPDQSISSAFKGKKIRVMGSQILMDEATLLGGSPVAMDVPELYTALQQGTIEGMGVAPVFMNSGKYYEVAKNMFIAGGDYEISILMVNLKWLQSLPADLQKILKDAAQAVIPAEKEYAIKAQDDALKNITAKGGTVSYATDAQMAELKALSPKIAEQFLAKNPDVKDIYNKMVEAVKNYKK